MRDHLVAVDIGTGSARAAVFDRSGALLAKASFPILMNRASASHAEHDSEDIWNAVTASVRQARAEAGIGREKIAAIAFDATCSLVVRGGHGAQLSVSPCGNPRLDTLVWLDHRAMAEADELTASGHRLVSFAGGRISPEMALPKLMWLKRHLPETWNAAQGIFDLADYMTYRASGSSRRSLSTLTAKWTFLAHEAEGWQGDFLALAGLVDMAERTGISAPPLAVGQCIGPLTPEAARELDLDESCVVAPGLIDAYAGAIGLLADRADEPEDLERQVALVAGTSSCLARFSRSAEPLAGFWGPYFGVGLPDFWLTEGGQSAAGALLDHVVRMHAAGGDPGPERHAGIIDRITELRAVEGHAFGLPIDVLPDFHGNRSPLGNPQATGVLTGLTLDTSFDGLCRLYWRVAVGIACGIRHILEALEASVPPGETLHMAGGHARNPLLVELYADVTGRTVFVPALPETVLLGTAMTAAVAAGLFDSLTDAGKAMVSPGTLHQPDAARHQAYQKDYTRFLAMIRHRAELDALL